MSRGIVAALAMALCLLLFGCGDEWRWCGLGAGPDEKWCYLCPDEDTFDDCCSFFPRCDACVEVPCT